MAGGGALNGISVLTKETSEGQQAPSTMGGLTEQTAPPRDQEPDVQPPERDRDATGGRQPSLVLRSGSRTSEVVPEPSPASSPHGPRFPSVW